MQLITALRYTEPACTAFVGAGGKTSAIFSIAREVITSGINEIPTKSVFMTTTTHLGAWQANLADHLIFINNDDAFNRFSSNIPEGITVLSGGDNNDFLEGMSFDLLEKLYILAKRHRIPLFIEADGSHMRPLKAPAEYEPAIPDFAELVVVVAGMQGVGKPMAAPWVHRPEMFGKLSGILPGQEVTPSSLVKVLISKRGGLKNIPKGAKRVVLLNQADEDELQKQAIAMSDELLARFQAVVISSLVHGSEEKSIDAGTDLVFEDKIHAVVENIAAVILAAGGSSRFGKPKQLIEWKGDPLIVHVIRAAREADLSPLVVVLGSTSEQVRAAIQSNDLRIVINKHWKNGLSESIKTSLKAIPEKIAGAVFLMADQPQIPSELIRKLVTTHQKTMGSIVAPLFGEKRGNPVLFDARTFKDLTELTGDVGGRVLFDRYTVNWVEWDDPYTMQDIDSPEDYQNFLDHFLDEGINK
jgi:molybdenum cofactor cytidylyltransferase